MYYDDNCRTLSNQCIFWEIKDFLLNDLASFFVQPLFSGCRIFILCEIHCYLCPPKSWHNNSFLSSVSDKTSLLPIRVTLLSWTCNWVPSCVSTTTQKVDPNSKIWQSNLDWFFACGRDQKRYFWTKIIFTCSGRACWIDFLRTAHIKIKTSKQKTSLLKFFRTSLLPIRVTLPSWTCNCVPFRVQLQPKNWQ